MTKEKERKNCYKLYKALTEIAGEPKKIYLFGQGSENEVLIGVYENDKVWTAQIHTLSGFNYVSLREEN